MTSVRTAGQPCDPLNEHSSAAQAADSPPPPRTEARAAFASILFAGDGRADQAPPEPACFGDLHLDQIVASVTAGREEYDLAPFFRQPLHTVDEVRYRHEMLRDLEHPGALELIRAFAEQMRAMRKQLELARKLHYRLQKERWFLSAVTVYRDAVARLAADLADTGLDSTGLTGLREHVRRYTQSAAFTQLGVESDELTEELGAVCYAVQIKGPRVRVAPYEEAGDLIEEVEQTFERFKQGSGKDYRVKVRQYPEVNHVEAQILELVARLHPETFSRLEQYCTRYEDCFEQTILRFDREIQFYLAYLEHIETVGDEDLAFSLPEVAAGIKDVHARAGFDLSLATKLADQPGPVVCNDFWLTGSERILVVTGPNQGGKTTFARMFGQLHYLGSLGLPVPASQARLVLADGVFTHFEREESLETLRGKFEDELVRIHRILDEATSDSLLVMNESFGSTTLQDALQVGAAVVRQIVDLDALCVFVTFVDELSRIDDATVSMMSTVDRDDRAQRTFKIERKPADGLAYAAALAERYGLTYDSLRGRISR